MKTIIWRYAVAILVVVLSAPVVVRAQTPDGPEENNASTSVEVPINYEQLYGLGFATDEEVEDALGTLTFSMIECGPRGLGEISRSVRVTATKWNYGNRRAVETILRRAADFAWQTCPLHFFVGMSYAPALHRDIGYVDLYLPDGSQALRVSGLSGDEVFYVGKSYRWASIEDIGEQHRQEAAQKAAQMQQEQQRAEAYARYQAERDQYWSNLWSNVWSWIKFAFWCAIAAWLFSKRETIMRWYYFLTPHPAKGMVEAAMHRGAELDGKAFSEIMRPIPGGRIEKEVRAQQAQKLALRARSHAEAMRAEADRIKAKAEHDTEFIHAQAVLDEAVKAHEKAKAQVEILRKLVR